MLRNVLLIAFGGALGAVLRYLVSLVFVGNTFTFPFSTFIVNITGSFAMGALLAYLMVEPNLHLRMFLAVGVLGGFTTFSAFSGEIIHLFSEKMIAQAILYAVATNIFCIVFAYLGYWIVSE